MSKSDKIYLLISLAMTLLFCQSITSVGVDIALHNVLVDKIFNDFWINSGYVANLGEMLLLPPGAHYLAAGITNVTNDSLISLNILTLLALALIWYCLSKTLLRVGSIAFFTMIFLTSLYLTQRHPALLGFEVVGNFLFSQFIASAFLIWCIHFLENNKKMGLITYTMCLLAFIIGLFIHATFSVIFLAGTLFKFLVFSINEHWGSSKFIKEFCLVIIYGVFGLVVFYFHPYSEIAQTMKLHNGSLGFSGLAGKSNLDSSGYILIISTFCYSLFFLIQYVKNKAGCVREQTHLDLNCYLFGASLVCAFQLFLMHLDVVSYYVVKKNFFVMGTFFLMAVSMICEIRVSKISPSIGQSSLIFSKKKHHFLLPLIFLVVCLSGWSKTKFSFFELDKSRSVAEYYHNFVAPNQGFRKTVADFRNLPVGLNFLITLSELQVAKDTPATAAVVIPEAKLPDDIFVLSEHKQGYSDIGWLAGQYRIYKTLEK